MLGLLQYDAVLTNFFKIEEFSGWNNLCPLQMHIKLVEATFIHIFKLDINLQKRKEVSNLIGSKNITLELITTNHNCWQASLFAQKLSHPLSSIIERDLKFYGKVDTHTAK